MILKSVNEVGSVGTWVIVLEWQLQTWSDWIVRRVAEPENVDRGKAVCKHRR